MTEGFDVGLEMSGVPKAFADMLLHMNHGGKVALLGIPPANMAIDWNQVIFKGLEIKGIYGREMFETWYKMVAMLQSGLDLSPIITHHYAFEEFESAFATMLSGQSGKGGGGGGGGGRPEGRGKKGRAAGGAGGGPRPGERGGGKREARGGGRSAGRDRTRAQKRPRRRGPKKGTGGPWKGCPGRRRSLRNAALARP